MNEDVIFPKKKKDGELPHSSIPKDISEVGDCIRHLRDKQSRELFQKLDDDKELFNKLK